ncbi:uncharacterized protein LOC110923885 [Helianthus annuus]|uniref:uncharacterized protein LOC110923885 n=1 Tax=Helianthus annuus TaxID=4232 RepID=UPI000B8FEEE1|nr:uncharacterized protein LOC110923885 [Helianthus annuus]
MFQRYETRRPDFPFLFLLVMEAFSSMLKKAGMVGAVRGLVLPNEGPTLTHLLYADDYVIMGEWGINNIKNVARLLSCFYLVSGLKINLRKSSLVGLGLSQAEVTDMAIIVLLTVKWERSLLSILGFLVGAKMHRIINWKSVFDYFEARLALWKSSLLSIGGE